MHKGIVVAVSGLVLLTPTLAPARDLAAPDIRSEIIGQALRWSSSDGMLQGELFLEPDGSARLSLDGHFVEEAGAWRLDGDRLCTQWRKARGGEEKCYYLTSEQLGLYATTGGNLFRTLVSGV